MIKEDATIYYIFHRLFVIATTTQCNSCVFCYVVNLFNLCKLRLCHKNDKKRGYLEVKFPSVTLAWAMNLFSTQLAPWKSNVSTLIDKRREMCALNKAKGLLYEDTLLYRHGFKVEPLSYCEVIFLFPFRHGLDPNRTSLYIALTYPLCSKSLTSYTL